jgi:hypothetical protein
MEIIGIPKINNFDLEWLIGFNKNIFGFKVAVHDTHFVQSCNTLQ